MNDYEKMLEVYRNSDGSAKALEDSETAEQGVGSSGGAGSV